MEYCKLSTIFQGGLVRQKTLRRFLSDEDVDENEGGGGYTNMVKCRIVSEKQCLESTMKHGFLTCMRLNYTW